jgi:hypothetical protein
MSPFWASLCEALRGRGRNGTLFLFAMALVLAALPFTARLPREIHVDYVLPTTLGVLLLLLPFCIRNWQRERARRKEKLDRGGLSRDELDKARSKLVKGQVRKSS